MISGSASPQHDARGRGCCGARFHPLHIWCYKHREHRGRGVVAARQVAATGDQQQPLRAYPPVHYEFQRTRGPNQHARVKPGILYSF